MKTVITVKIRLEPYLKKYVIDILSKNHADPVIFPKGSNDISYLRTLLISKRDFDHRRIIEDDTANQNMQDHINIKLPWTRGKFDIRWKHFISPNDEKLFRANLKANFYMYAWTSGNTRFRSSNNQIINEIAEEFGFTDEPEIEAIRRNFYRFRKSERIPFAK
jgi:hypothetical protein